MMTTKTKNTTHTPFAGADIAAQPCGLYQVKETTASGKEHNWKFVKLAADRWFMVLENSTSEYCDSEMEDIYDSFRFIGEL